MPFTLIKGTFHVVSKEPDGDTLSFKAIKTLKTRHRPNGGRPHPGRIFFGGQDAEFSIR